MSRFKPYPEYKDSGVEWLGEVPVGWDVLPLKRLAVLNPGKSFLNMDRQQLCSFVPMEKLMAGQVLLDEERPIDTVFDGYTYFEDGDVLQAKVTPCFENGNVALAEGLKNGIGFGSTEINVLRPHASINSRYLFYRVQEDAYMRVCTASMLGAGGLKRVPTYTVNNFKIAAPAEEEQTQIARFLDYETARIDALIAEQERLIDLLKEKRRAVISHVVTKGLNPDAPMKYSGVEWLGEVPAHWEMRELKNLISVSGGSTPSKDEEGYWDGEIPWVTPKDMKIERLYDSIDHVTEQALAMTSLKPVAPGAVLIVVRGMILLHSVPVAINETEVTINQDMKAMTPLDQLTAHYLLMLMQGLHDGLFQYIDESAHGTKKLEWERFELLDIPLPPIAEQDAIVQSVSRDKNAIEELMNKSLSAMNLLQERRSALISAAVTGKIDVRDWQPPADVDTRHTVDTITTTEPA